MDCVSDNQTAPKNLEGSCGGGWREGGGGKLLHTVCNHAKGVQAWLYKTVCFWPTCACTYLCLYTRAGTHTPRPCVCSCYIQYTNSERSSSSSRIRRLIGIMQDAWREAMYFICFCLILSDGMCHIHPAHSPTPLPLTHIHTQPPTPSSLRASLSLSSSHRSS